LFKTRGRIQKELARRKMTWQNRQQQGKRQSNLEQLCRLPKYGADKKQARNVENQNCLMQFANSKEDTQSILSKTKSVRILPGLPTAPKDM
jgi:hypothetical protein